MKKRIKLLASLTSILLFVSCTMPTAGARSGAKPDWLEGEPGFYPNSQYLTATGSAGKAQTAKDRALANLSKIFEAHVRESSTTRSDTRVNIKAGRESYTKSHRLSQNIQISTDKMINGARIAETWQDKTLRTQHALAVLDRKQAGNNIRQEMGRLDQQTSSEMQRYASHNDPLLAMSALDKALSLQQQRLGLQNMLKVIDTSGRGKPSSWNLAELRGQLESRLQSLQITTAVDHDPIGKLGQSLKSAMGNAGFPAGNGQGVYTLVANLDVQDLGQRDGWYWLRGKLSVKLVEADGRVRGRKQWPLKVSALQHDDAESRLMTQVSKKLNQDIKSAILEFATGVN